MPKALFNTSLNLLVLYQNYSNNGYVAKISPTTGAPCFTFTTFKVVLYLNCSILDPGTKESKPLGLQGRFPILIHI